MLLFISDLHLDEQRPDITAAFLDFLAQKATEAKALYILGDLFEVWIGDDGMDSYQQEIARALKQLSARGVFYFCAAWQPRLYARPSLLPSSRLPATG